MATPNQAYVSNSVPFGGITVEIFRGQANPASIGEYIVESLTPTQSVIEGIRPASDGGDNGWWLVTGMTTGECVIQLATDATPTLLPGDYFSASIRRDENGAVIAERFVIGRVGHSVATTDYRKQSCDVRVDKFA